MILNGVIAVILRYFTELGSFWGHYVKVVKDTPILSNRNVAKRILVFSDI